MNGESKALVASPKNVDSILGKLRPMVSAAGWKNPERLAISARLALRRDPSLLEATQDSFSWALLDCARAGLEPDGRNAAIYTRNNKVGKVNGKDVYEKQAVYHPMVQGLIQTAVREGIVRYVHAAAVFEDDSFSAEFDQALGTTRIEHKPSLNPVGKIVAAYAVFTLRSGGTSVEVVTRKDLDKMAALTKGSVWDQWPEEMARKSAIRRGVKYLPHQSEHFSSLLEMDVRAETGAASLSEDDGLTITVTPHAQTNPHPTGGPITLHDVLTLLRGADNPISLSVAKEAAKSLTIPNDKAVADRFALFCANSLDGIADEGDDLTKAAANVLGG